jgi:hypothetical protein
LIVFTPLLPTFIPLPLLLVPFLFPNSLHESRNEEGKWSKAKKEGK